MLFYSSPDLAEIVVVGGKLFHKGLRKDVDSDHVPQGLWLSIVVEKELISCRTSVLVGVEHFDNLFVRHGVIVTVQAVFGFFWTVLHSGKEDPDPLL